MRTMKPVFRAIMEACTQEEQSPRTIGQVAESALEACHATLGEALEIGVIVEKIFANGMAQIFYLSLVLDD